MNWSSPGDLKQQVERRWRRGKLLAARLADDSQFPLQLKLRKPSSRDIANDFDAVRIWVQQLVAGSKAQREYGYTIVWQTINHRVHGPNQFPQSIVVETEDDALRWISKIGVIEQFDTLCRMTFSRFPELKGWVLNQPLVILERADEWEKILAVLAHFRSNPRPGTYLRQLDIANVDSKFIERRRGLFTGLLDVVLADEVADPAATGASGFLRRYGLRDISPLIRFRILDDNIAIQGLTDLSVLPEQFSHLRLRVKRVFITENKINGLAFPSQQQALVIFGLGYGLNRLTDIDWLHHVDLHYWGDIDTHGFAILDRLRGVFPEVQSFLMDRDTLLAHQSLWSREEPDKRYTGEFNRLREAEFLLVQELQRDRLGNAVRLEQERVNYEWLNRALLKLE